jgi:hypothetical protein
MKPALVRRLEGLEASNGPAVHWIWDNGNIDVAAEIAARIAAGAASASDRFITIGWQPAGKEGP